MLVCVVHRNVQIGSRSSETSVAVNWTLTFQSDTTAERTVHVVTSLAGQGVETLYEGTPAFLSFPVNLPREREPFCGLQACMGASREQRATDVIIGGKQASACGYGGDCTYSIRDSSARMLFVGP